MGFGVTLDAAILVTMNTPPTNTAFTCGENLIADDITQKLV